MKISNRTTNILAAFLLILMFLSVIFSVKDSSVTADEVPHIVAGYSYLTHRNYRLNPGHPPLIKDLAAIPLLFLDLNFSKEYLKDIVLASSWHLGVDFLYNSNNNADQILFWSRLPMILLLVFLGWFLFRWTKELADNKTALLVLTLFSFSSTFLAHGGLVTTDVGTTLGFVLAIYFYLRFLKNPTRKNTIFSGITLGTALLLKFFNAFLIPFLGIIFLIFIFLKLKSKKELLKDYFKKTILIGLISISCIWIVYQFHLLNYPLEKQLEDIKFTLSFYPHAGFLNNICLWLFENPFLRPFAHYLLGFIIIYSGVITSGNWPTYLLGTISSQSFWYYFPVVYLIKVPLALHVLILIAFFVVLCALRKVSFKKWLKSHFTELSMLLFVIIYWGIALRSKSQIGIRHILPTFPFIYILVSIRIKSWLEKIKIVSLQKKAIFLILFLLTWYSISSLSSFPYYLSYFNELVGGSRQGYKYVVDSNVDWGQDLKRLSNWVEKQGIEKIYIDYFPGNLLSGRTILKYYFDEKAILWYGSCWWRWWGIPEPDDFPRGNYLAVSATFLQTDQGEPRSDYYGYWGCYNWLNNYQPIAQIGNSIFVYYIY